MRARAAEKADRAALGFGKRWTFILGVLLLLGVCLPGGASARSVNPKQEHAELEIFYALGWANTWDVLVLAPLVVAAIALLVTAWRSKPERRSWIVASIGLLVIGGLVAHLILQPKVALLRHYRVLGAGWPYAVAAWALLALLVIGLRVRAVFLHVRTARIAVGIAGLLLVVGAFLPVIPPESVFPDPAYIVDPVSGVGSVLYWLPLEGQNSVFDYSVLPDIPVASLAFARAVPWHWSPIPPNYLTILMVGALVLMALCGALSALFRRGTAAVFASAGTWIGLVLLITLPLGMVVQLQMFDSRLASRLTLAMVKNTALVVAILGLLPVAGIDFLLAQRVDARTRRFRGVAIMANRDDVASESDAEEARDDEDDNQDENTAEGADDDESDTRNG